MRIYFLGVVFDFLAYNCLWLFRRLLRVIISRNPEHGFVNGVSYDPNNLKTALIVYSTSSFSKQIVLQACRSSDLEGRIICKTLCSKGFNVDLADARASLKIKKNYDLIIALGVAARNLQFEHMPSRRICYLTEGLPNVSLNNERNRVIDFRRRNWSFASLERSGLFYRNSDFDFFDSFIVLGDSGRVAEIKDFFKDSRPIVGIYPSIGTAASFERIEISTDFDIDSSLRRFCILGTGGVIHKGVDLLIEAFRKVPNCELHIFGDIGLHRYFYRSKIRFPGNIFLHGHVDLNLAHISELIASMGFVVLPSASEAVPSGVLRAMALGCVPLVTRNCGVNVAFSSFGHFLDQRDVEDLPAFIRKFTTNYPRREFFNRRMLAAAFAAECSLGTFSSNIAHALDEIN